MIAGFKTADDATWVVDTTDMKWERTSEPKESGVVTDQGPYVFALEGRTPDSEGPGAGLCSLMLQPEIEEDTLYIVLRANVETKDFLLIKPISQVRYQVMNPPKAEPEVKTEVASG